MKRLLVLAAAMSVAVGCDDLLVDAPSAGDPLQIYNELWEAFDRGYGPFATRGVEWSAARTRHLVTTAATQDELFEACTSLIAELDDGHVTLVAPGRPMFVAKRTFREDTYQLDIDLGLIFSRFRGSVRRSGPAQYGLLPGEIAYIHVADWDTEITDLDGVLEFFRGRAGVIVDLRHNPGGDFTNGFPFVARFADRRRLAFTTLTKTGPDHADLGQREEWYIEPEGPFQYGGPVVVLTNGYTNSAAERTLMALRTFPNVTIVGSTTAGNHGEKVGSELSNGWRFSIVPQVVTAADGVSYEGPGIPPDVSVRNTSDEIAAGFDRQFDAAVSLLESSGSGVHPIADSRPHFRLPQ